MASAPNNLLFLKGRVSTQYESHEAVGKFVSTAGANWTVMLGRCIEYDAFLVCLNLLFPYIYLISLHAYFKLLPSCFPFFFLEVDGRYAPIRRQLLACVSFSLGGVDICLHNYYYQ